MKCTDLTFGQIFWLLPPFLLFTLAFGGVIIPKINLILALICREYLADRSTDDQSVPALPVVFGVENPQCRIPEVQSLVSNFTLYGNLIAGLLSAVTSPRLGALSDRYGRRRIIAFTTMGMFVSEVITIVVATYPDVFSVNWFLLGYAFDGICGSFVAAMALTNAYASDCTPPTERAVTFAYFHGVLFTGIALGPLLAGFIVKYTGKIITIFYFALACHGVFLFFLTFLIPESLSQERQMAAREKKAFIGDAEGLAQTWENTLLNGLKKSNIFAPLKILWPTGEGTDPAVRRNLVFLAAVDTTMFGVAMGSMTVVVIYSGFAFGWDTYDTSLFMSVVNICRVTCLILLLPLISRLLRGPKTNIPPRQSGSDHVDLTIIKLAIAFDMMGYVGYATSKSGTMFMISGAIAAVGGMGSPTLQSALTKHVSPDRTGQVLGAMGLLHALARVVGPTVFNLIYSLTVGKFTQTVFVCLAGTFGVAFGLSWFIRAHGMFLSFLSYPPLPLFHATHGIIRANDSQ